LDEIDGFTNYPSIGGSVSVHTVDRASYVVPSGTIEKPVQRQAVAQPSPRQKVAETVMIDAKSPPVAACPRRRVN